MIKPALCFTLTDEKSIAVESMNLLAQDRSIYRELFATADAEQKSFLTKKEAMLFFSKTGIPGAFLEEVDILYMLFILVRCSYKTPRDLANSRPRTERLHYRV